MLSVRELEVHRGGRCLLTGLSFELDRGRIALVTGPNGSGKTSLLRVLAGLAPAAGGTIELAGRHIDRLEPEERAGLTYRGHLDGLKKHFTVRENLDVSAALCGFDGGYESVLEELDLGAVADRQVRYLSAGQRRRAGLASLRVSQARLWLLDEPLTNLDAAGRDVVGGWIREHLDGGGSAVVATHLPETLRQDGAVLIEL